MSHVAIAAYTAALVGTVLAGLFTGVAVANTQLKDPHEMAYRETGVLAGGALLAGLVFAVLGAGWLEDPPGGSTAGAIGLSLAAAVGVTVVSSAVVAAVARRYLDWSRTPAVLREDHEWE